MKFYTYTHLVSTCVLSDSVPTGYDNTIVGCSILFLAINTHRIKSINSIETAVTGTDTAMAIASVLLSLFPSGPGAFKNKS